MAPGSCQLYMSPLQAHDHASENARLLLPACIVCLYPQTPAIKCGTERVGSGLILIMPPLPLLCIPSAPLPTASQSSTWLT